MRLFIKIFLFISYVYCTALYAEDMRNIRNPFSVIPDDNYCDQAYVVVAKNGNWVSAMTTGPESELGVKNIVSSISTDDGKTWTPMKLVAPGAAWAIPYITPYGRIYIIYCSKRKFICQFSDDHGVTWSLGKYEIPVRLTAIDLINDLKADQSYFWSVAKPLSVNGEMCFTFSKYALHSMDIEEGWLMKSKNINTEKDPNKIQWTMLPEGDTGIVNPTMGSVQEEHTLLALKNGSLFCNFRTKQGYIGESYSHDGGYTWSVPQYMTYADGRAIKHPRACPRLFQCKNGKFLLWFHNTSKVHWWNYRNPVWVSGGVEKNGRIEWSQPEILLFDNDSTVKMSYPDLVESKGKYFITETQKTVCGVHEISNEFLDALWAQTENKAQTKKGIIFEERNISTKKEVGLVSLPDLALGGFSVELTIEIHKFIAGQVIADNRDAKGNGFWLWVTKQETVMFSMRQEDEIMSWGTDPGVLSKGKLQHIVFNVDGSPNIISVVVNGKFCDGGHYRHVGWSWFSWKYRNINTSKKIVLLPDFNGKIDVIRLYNRYLSTSESIGNYRNMNF